jgi:hypothetical protein
MPVGRSDYEERKENRIDSLANKAAKAKMESDQYVQKSIDAGRGIEFGQPILVGHHSEKRHRAAIAKQESAMQKAMAANDKSDYYQSKAEAATNNKSISGDNPEAVNLYKKKLAELEALQERMKPVNTYWRKHKTMKGYSGLTDNEAMKIDEQMKTAFSWEKAGPYKSWQLSNNSAEIRRIKEKLETLEGLDGMAAEIITFAGGEMRVSVDINRVQFVFDDKPSDEVRSLLKHNGFKWAPSESAWQRQRTLQAVRIAKGLISKLENI